MLYCEDCESWKENISKLDAPFHFLAARNHSAYRGYDGKPFKYCPWCSSLLQGSPEVAYAPVPPHAAGEEVPDLVPLTNHEQVEREAALDELDGVNSNHPKNCHCYDCEPTFSKRYLNDISPAASQAAPTPNLLLVIPKLGVDYVAVITTALDHPMARGDMESLVSQLTALREASRGCGALISVARYDGRQVALHCTHIDRCYDCEKRRDEAIAALTSTDHGGEKR